jgi:hypothetical protein
VERKGALCGGFYDQRQSRLNTAKKVAKLKQTLDETLLQSSQTKQAIQHILL